MRCTLLVLNLLLFTGARALAQKSVQVDGRDFAGKEWFFVSEVHSLTELPDLYKTIIPYLATNCGIQTVVLEMGSAAAYLLDNYVQYGDTTYFRYYHEKRRVAVMDAIRTVNAQRPEGSNKIHVRGMDFERMEFVIVVKKILEDHKVTGSQLYSYLQTLPDSLVSKVSMSSQQSQMRIEVYGKARKLFNAESEMLKKATGNDFPTLVLVMNNPAKEKNFALRDRGMYRNLQQQHITSKPFLCIAGGYHLQYHRAQVFPSLIKRLLKHNRQATAKVAMIEQMFSGTSIRRKLFCPEGTPPDTLREVIGPGYFTRNDSAMNVAYRTYVDDSHYRLVHKDVFRNMVTKDNHGLDSWFVFFGDGKVRWSD